MPELAAACRACSAPQIPHVVPIGQKAGRLFGPYGPHGQSQEAAVHPSIPVHTGHMVQISMASSALHLANLLGVFDRAAGFKGLDLAREFGELLAGASAALLDLRELPFGF